MTKGMLISLMIMFLMVNKTMSIILKYKNLLNSLLLVMVILLLACNTKQQNGVDSLIIENKIKWGMSYKRVEALIKENYNLKFFKKDQIIFNSNYTYIGGSFYGISMKGLKLLFKEDAIEGVEVWIDSKSHEEMLWKYNTISAYFTKVAQRIYYASNDLWMLCVIENDVNKYVTDIFMLPQGNKILIHFHKVYESKESILIN